MAEKPTVEPTDRSIPPVKMTKVIPTAMIALMAVWPTKMMRFCCVKKEGVSKEKTPIRTKSAISARKRNRRTPNESPNALDPTGGVGVGVAEAEIALIKELFLTQ